jgi:hypothetical protein
MSAANDYLTREQLCEWLHVSSRRLAALMAAGDVPRALVREGKPVWPVRTLLNWLEAAPRDAAPIRTALYRHFDERGTLLYVGISLCAIGRLAQHRARAEWFDRISEIRVEWFDSREEALAAEAAAIVAECPLHNVQGAAR